MPLGGEVVQKTEMERELSQMVVIFAPYRPASRDLLLAYTYACSSLICTCNTYG